MMHFEKSLDDRNKTGNIYCILFDNTIFTQDIINNIKLFESFRYTLISF